MSSDKWLIKYWLSVILILALSGSVFFYNLGKISLWDPDEPRGAVIAYEMLKSKDWIHLSYNGEPITNKPALVKPPLYYWSIAAFSAFQGKVDEFSARAPSALAGIGTALLVFLLGRIIFGNKAAFLGALIFISNHMIFEQARSAEIDMILCLLLTFSLFVFYSCYHGILPQRNILAAYLAMGLAVLAKGPLGVMVPVMVAGLYLLVQKDIKAVARMKPLTGLLLILLVASPWFILEGKAFGTEFFFRQNIERFFHAFDHLQPFYYYLVKLPLHFMPWTILLPATMSYWFQKDKEKNPGRIFLLIWFLSMLIFFSLSQSKRSIYILPLYPALSLLVGEALHQIFYENKFISLMRWVRGGGIFLIVLLILIGAAGTVFVLVKLSGLVLQTLTALLFITIWSALMFRFIKRSEATRMLTAFFVLAFSMEFFSAGVVYPELDARSRSSKKLCRMAAEKAGDSDLGCVGFHPPSAVFYINRERNRPLKDFEYRIEDGISFLKQGKTVYCLMNRSIYKREKERLEKVSIQLYIPDLPLKGWKWDLVFLTNHNQGEQTPI